MSDNINLDVVLRLMTDGLKKGTIEVEQFDDALKSIKASGKASGDAIKEAGNASVIATAKAARSTEDLAAKNLPRLRYALFDVSNSMLIAGTAMTGFATAAYGVNIAMDRAFADVLRTSEIFDTSSAAANNLRGEFEALFTSMPTSWAQLTEIGTLAGQLNIAADSVGEFTQLVAMFAATTDVSIEQSATAFGRLSQLLDVPANELQNLGSSILAVGVNSVATESQIIAISTQITSMAANAGFSADQVFGLSAALASLGTQPELSRGVITRLFTNIGAAINEGGDRLDAFGRLAGQTGDEFAKAWGDDASTALYTLMDGLGRVEETKAVQTLNDLGITASRDVPTILRLAQNSDVLAESLNVAAQGYQDGTALADQYGVITSTVAEKLNILANNFQMLVSRIGEADGVIGLLVDGLISVVQALNWIVDNPVAGSIAGISLAFTALLGVGLLVGSVAVRAFASFVALRTVMVELSASGFTASASLTGMATSLFGVAGASTTAATAVRGLGTALKFLPGIGLVFTALAIGAEIFGQVTAEAASKAEQAFGDLTGYFEAVKQDTQIFRESGEAIRTFSVAMEKTEGATLSSKDAAEQWLGVQGQAAPVLGDGTGAIDRQTIALGENAEAWIRKMLAENEFIQTLASSSELQAAATQVGFDINDFILAGLKGSGELENYMGQISRNITEVLETTPDTSPLRGELIGLESSLIGVMDSLISLNEEQYANASVMSYLGVTASDTARGLEEYNQQLRDAFDESLDAINGALGVEDALFNLGETLVQNGDAWDYFSEAGRANMGALISVMEAMANNDSPSVAAAKMQGLLEYIMLNSPGATQAILTLQNAISSLSGGKAVTAIAFNPASFMGGVSSGYQKIEKSARSAARAAREVREEVRTTADYAKDLAGVFNRAFEIRYDSSSTLDAIADQFQSIREASEEAARSIRTLQADLLGMGSDLKIQEYFLSIAVEYGDTTRAEAIRAQIAKTQADIASKTEDLNKAQSDNSKELTGNSAAARKNRAEMESLIKKYQDHVTALAASGLSAEELAHRTEILRQDFIRQSTQLGFNRNDVMRYAESFSDLSHIIRNVPRNVTISASTSAAETALREFLAKANSSRANVPIGASGNGYGAGQNYAEQLGFGVTEYFRRNPIAIRGYLYNGSQVYQVPGTDLKMYDTGGYTGAGGKYEPAGIVHKGEYVIPKHQVNQATGLPYADALGRLTRGQTGRKSYSGGGYVATSGGREVVDLSAMSIQHLAQVMDKYIVVNGSVIAQTATSANEFQSNIGAF